MEVDTLGVNSNLITISKCNFLVLGGPLDTESRPSVVND